MTETSLSTTCPVCGAPVRPLSGDEGTQAVVWDGAEVVEAARRFAAAEWASNEYLASEEEAIFRECRESAFGLLLAVARLDGDQDAIACLEEVGQ